MSPTAAVHRRMSRDLHDLPSLALALAGCAALATGCADKGPTSNGELGMLNYSLGTYTDPSPANLTDADIVTLHPQPLTVSLTEAGAEAAGGEAWQIVHRISPGTSVALEQEDLSALEEKPDRPPDLTLTAEDAGLYTLESVLNGEVFDRINVSFATPASIQLQMWLRAPYGETFDPYTEGPVAEGSQLAWQGVPLDADGQALTGTITTDFSAAPQELVVPAENVYGVDGDVSSGGAASLYFIEPGTVTLTMLDALNGASAEQVITVE